jgi:hypothetical protein
MFWVYILQNPLSGKSEFSHQGKCLHVVGIDGFTLFGRKDSVGEISNRSRG